MLNNRQSALINDLQEMTKGTLKNEANTSIEDILGLLQDLGDLRAAIEFKCGECCKTVSNGALVLVISDLVFVFPEGEEELILKECCSGKWLRKELQFIIIPVDKISSFEFYYDYCPGPGILEEEIEY